MVKSVFSKHVAIGLIFSFVLFYSPFLLTAKAEKQGNLIGFVYGKDGTSPIEGALVKVRNIGDGTVYESSRSNNFGSFKIEGVKEGLYLAGITYSNENFNLNGLIGIKNNETAKVSVSLSTLQQQGAVDETFVSQDFPPKNEIRVGKVVSYNPEKMEAWIFMEEGALRKGDNIRIKGYTVDFYQKIERMQISRSGEMKEDDLDEIETVIAGQTFLLEVKEHVEVSDFVYYVKKKKKVLAFFTQPCAWAALLAGSAAVISTTRSPEEGEGDVSPFR